MKMQNERRWFIATEMMKALIIAGQGSDPHKAAVSAIKFADTLLDHMALCEKKEQEAAWK